MNGRQFIYHMQGLTKTYPPAKKVLDNIHLSFYPDAKIGVLGVNGSGKSTLLRIMAGIDKDFAGEGWVAEGARVGYLEQEPQLDPKKTVRENVMEGVAAKKALLDRYNEIAANYSDETADEMAKLQDQIDSKNLWDLDSQVDLAMDALRCPADDADVTKLSGGERRRVALCRLLLDQPDLLLLDEPTNHLDAESVNWLEGHLRELSGRHPDRHPRPLLPRQRHRLDPRARSRPRHSLRGQLHLLAVARSRSAWSRKAARTRRASARWSAKANGFNPRRKRGRPNPRRATSAMRNCSRSPTPRAITVAQITIPVAERLGQHVVDFDHLKKGYGDNLLIDDLTFKLPPGGIVGVIGPNGAGKTTLFRMITGQEKPDAGTIKIGESVHLGYVDQSRDSLDGKKTVWEEISNGQDMILLGKKEVNSRAYCALVQFQGRRPAEEGRHAVGRRAQPRASRQDAALRRQSAAARRADQRSRRRYACGRWKRRWRISPAAPSSSATTAGSSTASPPTCSPSRATATSNGSRATSRTTKPTRCGGWAPTASSRTG